MQINPINKNSQQTSFRAKLSPALRELVGKYREILRANKQFDDFVHLRKTMVKIKFLCPGQEISDKFILNGKTQLIQNFEPNHCDNNLLDRVLEKLTEQHNLHTP